MSTMVTELVVRGASRREVRATPTHNVSLRYGMEVEDSFMQLVSREHIAIASDVRNHKPCIIGTRIAVEDVAMNAFKARIFLARDCW